MMKILIAGATGAIGRPLLNLLADSGYEIYGITQSQEKGRQLSEKGAKPVILNVLEREAVFSAMERIRPDIVINMLTSLPKEYSPEAMRKAAELDAKIRLEGGGYLQDFAEAFGVRRFITQSNGFWYEPGEGLADENTPLAFQATPGIAAGTRVCAEIENRLLSSKKIEGVVLRFGIFYGPGTWYHATGTIGEQVRRQQLPLIGEGEGVWSFVHIEDAASAIVSALKSPSGIYNIVDDQPTAMHDWLLAFARNLGAPQPPKITEEEGKALLGPDLVYYATKFRGASNAKAKSHLQFRPRILEWL